MNNYDNYFSVRNVSIVGVLAGINVIITHKFYFKLYVLILIILQIISLNHNKRYITSYSFKFKPFREHSILKVCQRLGAAPPDPRCCDRLPSLVEPPSEKSWLRAWACFLIESASAWRKKLWSDMK